MCVSRPDPRPAPPSALGIGNGKDDVLVLAAAALEVHRQWIAWLRGGDDALERLNVQHRLAIDLQDGVTRTDPRGFPGAARSDVGDEHAALGRQLEPLGRLWGEWLDLEAEHLLPRRYGGDLLLARLLAELDRERRRRLVADHDDGHRASRLGGGHLFLQIRHVLDGNPAELRDDVTGLHAAG